MTSTENTTKKPLKPGKTKKPAKIKAFSKKNKPKTSHNDFIETLQQKYSQIDPSAINHFTDFPLSPPTLKGLKQAGYTKPTDIQRETIGLALQGHDVLGAAHTGSGKTIAFLVPLLEVLYRHQWTRLDGLGALIITPTRELAYQIFETLRKIGVFHEFSAGLVIGGKDLKFERKRMDQCNIVICTPGRLLQHMDENPLMDCVNMKILILDEADRCLDMGFAATMNAIIANLPPKRQTLLFSATQTKSVKDLARLSLKDPKYVSLYVHTEFNTPTSLTQNYVVCNLQDKIPIIWSFIKNHRHQKSIIFFSTCKQVKYAYEVFCRLRPNVSLLALYGTLHQLRRMSIYETFCRKSAAVLFATDLVARGLDFPEVHWVVQADCPEDVATYVHRVGRTARYFKGGESLLLLLPSETEMVKELEEKKIDVGRIEINPMRLNNPVRKMEALLARDPSLKDTAQRAFISYIKSVFLMKDKSIFDANALDTEAYSKSLGLAITPRVRFLQRMNAKMAAKQATNAENKTIFSDNSESEGEAKMNAGKSEKLFEIPDSESDEEDILTVKRKDHEIEVSGEDVELDLSERKKGKALTKAALAKKLMKKKILPNKKIVFDDEGEAVVQATREKRSEKAKEYENKDESGINLEEAKEVLREEDKYDKQLFREKVKAKHKEQKKKLKEMKRKERDEFESDVDEDDAPDLSWLPDPDKIYGKDEREPSVNEESNQRSRKRKSKAKKPRKEDTKKKKLTVNDGLSVTDAEELALMLLNNK